MDLSPREAASITLTQIFHKILWHVDLLLGNDSEISNYTTAVTRQRPVNSNRERCFLCRPCRDELRAAVSKIIAGVQSLRAVTV
jgi:hypothetical protein